MSDEGFTMKYAKAIDDLAGKIFFPGLISSLLVEFGQVYQTKNSDGILGTYIFFVGISAVLSAIFF
jgi:hypothetical protein